MSDPFVDQLMARLRTTEAMRASVAHIEVSACPFCGASVGAYCHGRSGQRMVSKLPHNRRLVLARAQRAR